MLKTPQRLASGRLAASSSIQRLAHLSHQLRASERLLYEWEATIGPRDYSERGSYALCPAHLSLRRAVEELHHASLQ